MVDARLTKLAKILVNYSLKLKKGEFFVIDGNTLCEPLALEVYKEALAAGANPFIMANFEEHREILLKNGNEEQIAFSDPINIEAMKRADAMLSIWAEVNTKSLTSIDPVKLNLLAKGRKQMLDIFHERLEKGKMRWCGTQYPTYASAMDANMSLAEYEEFVFGSGYLDSNDPTKEWLRIHDEQQKLVDYLNTKKKIEVKSKDTNLSFTVEGRKWENCDGTVNFPDGEVFTSPIEDSMSGHVRFTYPAIYMNREVEDVELVFEKGRVVSAKAKKDEAFLNEILKTDEGAKSVGEFAIGTNYNIKQFTKNTLFDEKIGGTIHIAVGASVGDTGGKNKSAIHWDMICDMSEGEIYADGELFYKNGKWLI
ncbi:MAG TPA: aminopeptidase [Candidatus Nitrosocosmicus sp.]|nr:aminopeptidase [Candidatus Nitrosocosmicus sp.]